MPPQQQNPYGFILDPSSAKPRGPFNSGASKQRRLLGFGLLGGGVLIILIVGLMLLSGDNTTDDLRILAAKQTEIARISAYGIENASSSELRQYAATVNAVFSSDAQQTVAYVALSGTKLSPKQLAAGLDADRTSQLEAAIAQNSFDAVFNQALSELLADYRQSLQASLNAAQTPQRKTLVETAALNLLTIEQDTN